MRRGKGSRTRYPGVYRLDERTYRVEAKAINPRTGKVRRLERVLEGVTSQEAAKTRGDLVAFVKRGEVGGGERERRRLRDYARSWLSSRLPSLKPSTRARYAEVLDLHVIPALGDYYVDAIEPADITAFRDRQAEGRKGEKRPSAATVNGRLRVLRTLFADAVSEIDLPRDPTMRVRSLAEHAPMERKSMTAPELRRYLDALGARRIDERTGKERDVASYADRAMLTFLALTGCRFGEAAALKWEDIDEAAGVIHVRRSAWGPKAINVTTPKTGRVRTPPLAPPLAELLREHRRRLVEKQARGLAEGWVFPASNGRLRVPEALHKPHHRALAVAKVEHRVTVHGLRHTFNNLMRQVARGEVVRSVTGHTTESMTEHYSHVEHEEKQAAVGRVLQIVRDASTVGGTDRGTDSTRSEEAKKIG